MSLPSLFENVSLNVLYAPMVIVLPALSLIVVVSIRVVPAVRLPVEPLSASLLAAPVTTLNVIGLPVPGVNAPADPVAEAVIVMEPGALPVTISAATPADAVADPRPVTVPVPPVLAKVTLSV